jgi:hypothetical protein
VHLLSVNFEIKAQKAILRSSDPEAQQKSVAV